MFIPLETIISKYSTSISVTGCIHIGAHLGEEYESYKKNGIGKIVWIEAMPLEFGMLQNKMGHDPSVICINRCISDSNGNKVIFHVASNGQSSSLLELDQHLKYHPDVTFISDIELDTFTLDQTIADFNLDPTAYNFLNLNIQGAELLALKGASQLLSSIDVIYTEVNFDSVYKNCARIEDLDYFLEQKGFARVELYDTGWQWGDAVYLRVKK